MFLILQTDSPKQLPVTTVTPESMENNLIIRG